MPHSLSVFGLGYVGSVTAACLASIGNRVIGVDIDSAKAKALDLGQSPILEKGINELIEQAHKAGRLVGTNDASRAISESDISIVCVGTPSESNGRIDVSHLKRACEEIGEAIARKQKYHVIVFRSTVVPGTTESVLIPALEAASKKRCGIDFGVCYNPEFMREGSAVCDFFEPAVTILGASESKLIGILREVYSWVPGKIFETAIPTAEAAKYVSNAFHALKVTFANEIGTFCKKAGVDTESVFRIFTADARLNTSAAYLLPGFAFGGSCLPKDVRALTYRAKEMDLHLPVMESILPSNREHIERAAEAVLRCGKRKVGVLGLSFKSGTDDLRESPLIQLVKRLLGEGCDVQIWDKNVSLGKLVGANRRYLEEVIPHISSLLIPEMKSVIASSEVVVIGTREADSATLDSCLRENQNVIDLVNLNPSHRLNGKSHYEGICW
ncbi:MAG TPA: nucleotide sugar dehydrogenase [Terriglobales bacterium]|nr:nucleotide sugar dehydrogenase [Terriglobales bacterium]